MFLFPCHSGYRNIVCYEYKHIDHFQPHNYFPAQSLHFRFGSVAPCPTLKSDVTASTPRTRYRRLAKPYLTGFSCCTQSAYKSKQSSLCSLEEISSADFSARTVNKLYINIKKDSCHFFFIFCSYLFIDINSFTTHFLIVLLYKRSDQTFQLQIFL